jgi:ribosomal protein S2
MKTKKFKFKQLLKLHLLKSRVYEHPIKKTNFNDLIAANLDQIIVGIKRALQVIFQYHQINKRILFVGLPSKLELKINSSTRHIAIARSFNIQGLISNNNINSALNIQTLRHTSVKQSSALLTSKFAKKPNLIVLFDHDKSASILSEAWVAKIPVINFASKDSSRDCFTPAAYFINGNFTSILSSFDKNIFFISLNFLFKNLNKKQKRFSSDFSNFNSKSFTKNKKRSGLKNK